MYTSSFIPGWLRRKISPLLVSAVAGSAAVPVAQYVPEQAAWAEPGDVNAGGEAGHEKEGRKKAAEKATAEETAERAEAAEETEAQRQVRKKAEWQAAFLSGLEEAVEWEVLYSSNGPSVQSAKTANPDSLNPESVTNIKVSLDGKKWLIRTASSDKYSIFHEFRPAISLSFNPFLIEQFEREYSSRRLFFGYDQHGLPAYFFRLRTHLNAHKMAALHHTPVQKGDIFHKLVPDKEYTFRNFIFDLKYVDEPHEPPFLFSLLLHTMPSSNKNDFCFSAGKLLPALAQENVQAAYKTLDTAFSCVPPTLVQSLSIHRKQLYEKLPSARKRIAEIYDALTALFLSFNTNYTPKMPSDSFSFARIYDLVNRDYGLDNRDFQALYQIAAKSNYSLYDQPQSLSSTPDGRIVRLNLSGSGLQQLDPAIGRLDALEELILSDNMLVSLPDSFYRLQKLKKLVVSKNPLSSLPDSLGDVPLRVLRAEGTRLRNMPLLPALEELYLSGTNFGEGVPEDVFRLSSLKVLELNNTEISAVPDEIRSLQNLRELSLRNNELTVLPEGILGLSSLESLDVSYNLLLTLPESQRKLTELKDFRATSDDILTINQDDLRTLYEMAGELRVAPLYYTLNRKTFLSYLVGKRKLSLSQNGRIVRLNLDGTGLQQLDPAIGRLDALEELVLSYNPLVSLPDSLGDVPLRVLWAEGTRLRNVPLLPALEELYLSGTKFGEGVPEDVFRLSSLKVLELDNTGISAVPDEIRSLQNLRKLSLRNNELTVLPEGILGLSSLESLDMFNNKLKKLPSGLQKLYDLAELNLLGNDDLARSLFSGFPSSFQHLQHVNQFSISPLAISPLEEKIPRGEIAGTDFIYKGGGVFVSPVPFFLSGYFQGTGNPLQINAGIETRVFFHQWHTNLAFRERYTSLPIRRDVLLHAGNDTIETSFAGAYNAEIHIPQLTLRVGRELAHGIHLFGMLSQKWHLLGINEPTGSDKWAEASFSARTPQAKLKLAETLSFKSTATQAGAGVLLNFLDDSLGIRAEYAAEIGYAASGKYRAVAMEYNSLYPVGHERKIGELRLSPENARAHHLALRANYQLTNHLFMQAGVESNGNAGLLCRLVGCEGDYGSEQRLVGIGYIPSFDEGPASSGDAFTLGLILVHGSSRLMPFDYGGYSLFGSIALTGRNFHKALLLPDL